VKKSAFRPLLRRSLWYIGVALAILLIVLGFVAISFYTGHTHPPPVGWFGLVGFTPLVFWAVITTLRLHWDRPVFWFAIAGLAGLHVALFTAILMRYPQWPLLWFIPVSMIEGGLFVVVLTWLFDQKSKLDR
jgi:hypothetical protein